MIAPPPHHRADKPTTLSSFSGILSDQEEGGKLLSCVVSELDSPAVGSPLPLLFWPGDFSETPPSAS